MKNKNIEDKVYFLHIPEHYNRRGTIAGVINGDALYIGVALCSHEDQFCKKIGRYISEGRARKTSMFKINISQYLNRPITPEGIEPFGKCIHRLLEGIMKEVIQDNNICRVSNKLKMSAK